MQGLIFTARRPGGPSQNVSFTSTSACVSNALPPGAQSVTVYASVAAFVRVAYGATSVTATASDIPIPANTPVAIPIPQRSANEPASNQGVFVAVIGTTVTSAGTMYAQPNAD